jgi:DNA-binding NarL/FixJ family response regulator
MKNTFISIVEDHDDTLQRLVQLINFYEEFEITSLHHSAVEFLSAPLVAPDGMHVLLLDIGLPQLSGIDAIPLLLEKYPDLQIVMLSGYEEEDTVLAAICAGACSYISKKTEPATIIEGLRIVRNGGAYLSPGVARGIVRHLASRPKLPALTLSERQKEILHRLADGKSYASIASELYVSIETVRTHVKHLYRAMNVANKTEAVSRYLRGQVK